MLSRPADNLGGFQILFDQLNVIVAGERFDLDLDDVEQWIASQAATASLTAAPAPRVRSVVTASRRP